MIEAMYQVVLGLVCGYLTISVCESLFHRIIQHASLRVRRFYAKVGRLGETCTQAWYSHHVVHHVLTYRRSHVRQFADSGEQARLDAHLAAKGRHDVIATRYGATIGVRSRDYLWYMAPTLPFFVALCLLGGAWFSIGALFPLMAWPILAQVVHPYLHMSYDEIATTAPTWFRAFARTCYFRRLAQHHWLHHHYGDCNFNLLQGGDLLLRVHRTASEKDLRDMRAIGLWVAEHAMDRPADLDEAHQRQQIHCGGGCQVNRNPSDNG